MPRKGQTGLTPVEKDERTKILDQKVQAMLDELMARPEKDQGPDKALLKKHLSQKELGVIWKRLENARGGAPPTIEAAWNDLKKLNAKVAKQERCNTLFAFLQKKDWQQVLLSVKDKVTRSHTQTVQKDKYYWGELKQKHGLQEATDFVRKGKFREIKDFTLLFIHLL